MSVSSTVEDVECPICYLSYDSKDKVPRNLFCGHSLCCDCIKRIAGLTGIECPLCKRFTRLRVGEELAKNFAILALIEGRSRPLPSERPSDGTVTDCEECQSQIPFDSLRRCATCEKALCLSCIVDAHNGHRIEKIDIKKMREECAGRVRRSEKRLQEAKTKSTSILDGLADSGGILQQLYTAANVPSSLLEQIERTSSREVAEALSELAEAAADRMEQRSTVLCRAANASLALLQEQIAELSGEDPMPPVHRFVQ